jgi:hypothetical protein
MPRIIIALTALLVGGASAVSAQPQLAERPTLRVGATWVRDDGRFELVRADSGQYVFVSAAKELHLTADLAVFKVLRSGAAEQEFSPPPRIPWPLRVGARASVDGTWKPPGWGGQATRVTSTWTVEAYEEIQVPAGRFGAFRLVLTIREASGQAWGGRRSQEWSLRAWYAPEPQQFVRAEGQRVGSLGFEVVAIEPPGAGRPTVAQQTVGPKETPGPATGPPPAVPPALPPVQTATRAPASEPAASGLQIALTTPRDQERVAHEQLALAGVASAGAGISRVVVALNGVEVSRVADAKGHRAVEINAPLSLREGHNVIVVTAVAVDGVARQEVRTVVLEQPRAVTAPSKPASPANYWAVVIGVGRYESPNISPLRYTVPDAEAIYRTLTGPVGLKQEQVVLLTDRAERKPTLRNIRWALGTFLARSALKDDTVLVFFAGHGAPEIDLRGVERDGLSKYLVPADADPDDLYSTALPMDEIHNIFSRIEAERVVVFLDACYSGAAGGRTFAAKRTRATNVDDLFLERLTRSKGRAIITASRASEVSLEIAELGHGLFTYHLLEGLRGAADSNRDSIVSLQELYEYVEGQVVRQSRAVGGNQHPVMKGELEGVLPLARVTGR